MWCFVNGGKYIGWNKRVQVTSFLLIAIGHSWCNIRLPQVNALVCGHVVRACLGLRRTRMAKLCKESSAARAKSSMKQGSIQDIS